MQYSVRLLNKSEKFHAYLSHRNNIGWSLQTAMKHAKEFIAQNPNYEFELEDEFGNKLPHPFKGRLPLNEDALKKGQITYHRKPTASEIKFGYGATHYADFDVEDCCEQYLGAFYPKNVYVSPQDGLRYYR